MYSEPYSHFYVPAVRSSEELSSLIPPPVRPQPHKIMYKTTAIPILLRETGWAPAQAWLERIQDRCVARVAAADPRHPLRARWDSPRLQWMRRRQEVELAPNHHTPPWATDDRTAIKQRIGAIGREKGGPAFRQWVSEQSPLDLTVYSDGSLNEDGSAGAGFCVYRGTQEIARGQVPLGHTTEVYDAEIEGALAGLRAAAAHYMARFATKLTICLDNEEAALRLHSGTPTDSSATAILDFKSHKLAWAQRERAPNAAPGQSTSTGARPTWGYPATSSPTSSPRGHARCHLVGRQRPTPAHAAVPSKGTKPRPRNTGGETAPSGTPGWASSSALDPHPSSHSPGHPSGDCSPPDPDMVTLKRTTCASTMRTPSCFAGAGRRKPPTILPRVWPPTHPHRSRLPRRLYPFMGDTLRSQAWRA